MSEKPKQVIYVGLKSIKLLNRDQRCARYTYPSEVRGS